MTTTREPATESKSAPSVPAVDDRSGRRRGGRRRVFVNAIRLAIIVVLVGGWEGLARVGAIDPFFFGQPTRIIAQLQLWVSNGTEAGPLWVQVRVTLTEALLGFGVGVVFGVVAGVALGRVRLLAEILSPYIKALNAIPRIVLGSIFIVWLGLGMPSKVALAAVLVFFAVFFNAFQGTREVDRTLVANARILGAGRRQVTLHVFLPSTLTWIVASLHISFGFALIGAIVGEFLGAERGLGLLIAKAQATFDANGVFAAMVIIAVVALAAEFLIGLLERVLLAWRPPQTTGPDL